MNSVNKTHLFTLGRIAATPGALAHLEANGCAAGELLERHQTGDWGDLSDEDHAANLEALKHGYRVLSAYMVGKGRIWIITEADCSTTTILLPEEY